jgi:hypothetical protein
MTVQTQTPQEALVAQLTAASRATTLALEAMQQTPPPLWHFYPDVARYTAALRQHTKRMAHLQDVLESLRDEVRTIERSGKERISRCTDETQQSHAAALDK